MRVTFLARGGEPIFIDFDRNHLIERARRQGYELLSEMTVEELREVGKSAGVTLPSNANKETILERLEAGLRGG